MPHEGLLRGIEGRIAVAEHPGGEAVEAVTVAGGEGPEGLPVTGDRRPDEPRFASVLHWVPPSLPWAYTQRPRRRLHAAREISPFEEARLRRGGSGVGTVP